VSDLGAAARIVALVLALSFGASALGCASGGETDWYQRGPTKHWDSFPGYSSHGPGYYTYGRPYRY
jgi:hypothetical protein